MSSNEITTIAAGDITADTSVDELLVFATRLSATIDRAERKINEYRIELGRVLLELRRRVETGEVGDLAAIDWWGWYEGNFTRSRRDAERLMAIASADNPVKALQDSNARNAAHQQTYRARHQIAAKEPESEPLRLTKSETEPQPEILPPAPELSQRPLKRFPDSPDDDAIVEEIAALFERLSWDGKATATKRLLKIYNELQRRAAVSRSEWFR